MVLSYDLKNTPERYLMTKQCKQTKLVQATILVKINGKLVKATSFSQQSKDGKMEKFCLCETASFSFLGRVAFPF